MGDVGGAGCEVELEGLLLVSCLLCVWMFDRVDWTYEASILQAGRDLFGDML